MGKCNKVLLAFKIFFDDSQLSKGNELAGYYCGTHATAVRSSGREARTQCAVHGRRPTSGTCLKVHRGEFTRACDPEATTEPLVAVCGLRGKQQGTSAVATGGKGAGSSKREEGD